ncbi:DNA binding protein [Phytophthora megakarya]|uniref:DNA binding protein n=1 Tax=Phytophthora megakarya TaxID=4795 RepID=A0A225X2R1_9STRA|nr:DNA binding protein [Phytophthora megakarya]
MSGNKRKTSNVQQTASKRQASSSTSLGGNRTLVCAVRGLHGRVCIITISADASIHSLKELIHQQNALQLTNVTPTTFDIYTTNDPNHGWAWVSDIDVTVGRATPPSETFLLPTKRIRHYFPSTIPAFDSGVVHVIVGSAAKESLPLQVQEVQKNTTPIAVGRTPLPDDKPTRARDDESDESDEDEEYLDEEIERCRRVREALGLYVGWGILGTDFSQKHKYQGIQWLEYTSYDYRFDDTKGHLNVSRVYIGDKTTWRELYVACNNVMEKCEGRVGFQDIEALNISKDGTTLKLGVGT